MHRGGARRDGGAVRWTKGRPPVLTERDQNEIDRFGLFIDLDASRRAGGDPAVLKTLEDALYPEGIGRPPADGPVDA